MRVISNKALVQFARKYPDAEKPLQNWRRLMEAGRYRQFADLKRTFGSVYRVGELMVFNIGDNKYRLIVFVQFQWQQCFIKHVLTHREYNKGNWKR